MAVAFASATNRRMVESSLLASVLWIGVAVVLGHMFSTAWDSPWLLAGLIYAAFVALSLVWWVTRAFITWLVWRILWRKTAANNLIASFEAQELPAPPPRLVAPEDWFAEIVSNNELPVEQRLAAGGHYLRINELAREQGVIAMMRTKAVYEDAIAGYRAAVSRGAP